MAKAGKGRNADGGSSTPASATTTKNNSDSNNNNDDKKEKNKQQPTPIKSTRKSSSSLSSIFSLSCGSTVFMALYMFTATYNLYRLMYPLAAVDLSKVPAENFVKPLWPTGRELYFNLRVYLSTRQQFHMDFLLQDEEEQHEHATNSTDLSGTDARNKNSPVALLWQQAVHGSPAFSKSFLLTTTTTTTTTTTATATTCDSSVVADNEEVSSSSCKSQPRLNEDDASYKYAVDWLDNAERQHAAESGGGVLATISASAGQGIESTSVLITAYQSLTQKLRRAWVSVSSLVSQGNDDDAEAASKAAGAAGSTASGLLERTTVRLRADSKLWSALASNSTLYVHVVVIRTDRSSRGKWPPPQRPSNDNHNNNVRTLFRSASRSHGVLLGKVNLVKYDAPHHITKPKRILYHDVVYLLQKYLLWPVVGSTEQRQHAPWDMKYSKPDWYREYKQAQEYKAAGMGYPYWKPQVSIKYVNDREAYPVDMVGHSGMPLAQVAPRPPHNTGYVFLPALHVDEIGLTSEKYIPVNETLTSLPLRISFDRNDMTASAGTTTKTTSGNTATAGGLSPARWRLLSHLSQAIEHQQRLGFEQSDIDDVRRLIADTNVTLLAITMLASALHLLFEFLTFKSEVSFWSQNKDLTGLSVRSLFLDMMGQCIILLYLIERDASLLMTVPSAIGCLIALWKCQRGAGLKFVRRSEVPEQRQVVQVAWYNWLPYHLFGYELRATRLEMHTSTARTREATGGNQHEETTTTTTTSPQEAKRERLRALTIESDRIATRTLGSVLLPLVACYVLYSFLREEHAGWYSWIITSASSAVYALGFVLMTPQLFLNYKLRSVAHLPWRVLVYRSLNTFIDDLFSFIIRMPTMARISCFRDDIVFFIYLYQRWLYPVDASRPVEGGGGGDGSAAQPSKSEQHKNEDGDVSSQQQTKKNQ